MGLLLESRASESPWVSSVWTGRSEGVSRMTSVANETWGLVLWRQAGASFAAVTGPETRAGTAPVPEDAEFLGIQFTVGTSLRAVPTPTLVDSGIELPDVDRRRFRLDGDTWETPRPDDAELLVERLVRRGAIVRDPLVTAVILGHAPPGTSRTVQRRFRASTGLTRGLVTQIARARDAALHLAAGVPVGDTVSLLGFHDEPHLARALRRFVGRTAGELRDGVGGAIAL